MEAMTETRSVRDQGFDDSVRLKGSVSSSWTNGRPWSRQEEDELREMASTQTISAIAKRLCRSEMSVRLKLKGLRFEYQDLAGFKAKDLAGMLGITIRQVRRWRQKGYIESISGRISEDSFAKFCRSHGEKIPYHQLDSTVQLWLREHGYRAGNGFSRAQIASLLRVNRTTIRRWVTRHWLNTCGKSISEDSLRRFCRLHSDKIDFANLSPQAQETVIGLGYPAAGETSGR